MIPTMLWTTLCVAGAVALAVYAWRRPAGLGRGRWAVIIGLMGAAYVLIMGVLLNPLWAEPVPPPPGKPLVTILVDASASMGTADAGAGGKTRYAAAIEAARVLESAAGKEIEVRVRGFDEKVRPASVAELADKRPAGAATDIGTAILMSIEPDRSQAQAVVLLTDAIQTGDGGMSGVREAARFAKSAGVPIYGQAFGGQAGGIDVSVDSRMARELAFVGQKVTLTADVKARGYSGAAVVRLLADGKEVGNQTVQMTANVPAQAQFEVMQQQVGLYPYELKVDGIPAELTDANNSALCLLRVVDKPTRVMLLEGKPYWDSKFLMRHLAADASIEMQSLVQLAPGRVMVRSVRRAEATSLPHAGPTSPPRVQAIQDTWQVNKDPASILADPASLAGFQVLILGRDTQEFLSDAAVSAIQHWLSKEGGTLICYRGSPVSQVDESLGRMLPVKWQAGREGRFQLKLTESGRDLNWFGAKGGVQDLGGLPALAASEQVALTKPLAVVVANASWRGGEDTPAVTYQPYGGGRVVVIEGAGMWRWAFPPPRSQEGETKSAERVYGSLWHALFRWIISDAGLVPGEMAALRPDKTSFGAKENAAATLLVRLESGGATTRPEAAGGGRGGGPVVRLKRVGTEESAREIVCEPAGDDPGAYRANFGVLPPGRYEGKLASDGSVRALFDVQKFGEEELNLAARPDVLARMAEESGGAVLTEQTVKEMIPRFKEHMVKSRPARVAYTTAWDRWWLFVAALVLWATAWSLRRSSGLV
jgi:hypothetical protein